MPRSNRVVGGVPLLPDCTPTCHTPWQEFNHAPRTVSGGKGVTVVECNRCGQRNVFSLADLFKPKSNPK